jgi:hypothetical protein
MPPMSKSLRRTFSLAVGALATTALGGCYYGDVNGASYASAGGDCAARYGDAYYDYDPYAYDDGYGYDCYDASDYSGGFVQIGFGGGWYDDYYYPGYGLWMFDNYRNRYPLRGQYLNYWGGRRAWWKHDRNRGDGHWNGDRPGRPGRGDGAGNAGTRPIPSTPSRPGGRPGAGDGAGNAGTPSIPSTPTRPGRRPGGGDGAGNVGTPPVSSTPTRPGRGPGAVRPPRPLPQPGDSGAVRPSRPQPPQGEASTARPPRPLPRSQTGAMRPRPQFREVPLSETAEDRPAPAPSARPAPAPRCAPPPPLVRLRARGPRRRQPRALHLRRNPPPRSVAASGRDLYRAANSAAVRRRSGPPRRCRPRTRLTPPSRPPGRR